MHIPSSPPQQPYPASSPQQPANDGPPQRIAMTPSSAALTDARVRRWLDSAVLRDAIQAFALFLAAVWGVYTFIYKEVVLPARQPAALVVTPSLEAIGRRGDLVLARATFHMVNHSDSKVYVPAMWYAVRGLKLELVATEDTTYLRENREAASKPYPTARFSRYTAADVIATGKVSTEVETWFEPDAEQRVEHLLYIPADRYDAAQLGVEYLISKDISDVREIRWRTTELGDLEPRMVFHPKSSYGTAGLAPAAMSDTSARYLGWLRATHAGVNYVTATISLWGGTAPKPAAAPAPAPAPEGQ
ncbi:MAG TPA: hypothetical protein VFS20_20815 [Longimicrobium sp.]|nr:hypothetical protein [Longimicrobium sp.]